MRTSDDIIRYLGNTTAVAKALGVSISTVQSWKEANFIPAWRQPELVRLAFDQEKDLSTADFPPKAARKSRFERRKAAA